MPTQPSINRGTLILLAPNAKDASISAANPYFAFQYNPEKLFHTFNPLAGVPLGATTNPTSDPQNTPTEFFSLTFELDSTDLDPPNQNQNSSGFGLHPTLAILELMMQPQMVNNQKVLPIIVFKWGAKRTIPVRFVSISIEEKSFDGTLNPTRAIINLTMRVLDPSELNNNPGARDVSLNHQNVRTTLVQAYKQQTGQAPQTTNDKSGASVSATAASGIQNKQKIIA